MSPVTLVVGGHSLVLLAEKAVWLPEHQTLLVADAHIGKAVSFRALGVPVPRGTTSQTLDALDRLVVTHAARRIVFLGDFLHSARSHAPATLTALALWRARHAGLDLTLVRGNHVTARVTRRAPSASSASTSRCGWTDSPCATTRGGAIKAMYWPGTCTRASAFTAVPTTGCACRVSGSATESACCRRSVPSPACTRYARRPAIGCSRSPTTGCSRWVPSAEEPFADRHLNSSACPT